MKEPTDVQIAESRDRLNIPEDWTWVWCEADCGEIVWTPDLSGTGARTKTVCSSACAMSMLEVISRDLGAS